MTRLFRLSTLTALVGLAFGLAPSAQANYDVTTSITSVTNNGVTVAPSPAGVYTIGTAVITLGDFTQLNNPPTQGTIASESVTLTGSFPGLNSTVVVTEAIKVTNPSPNGPSATFIETTTYNLTSTGLVAASLPTLTPSTQPVDGMTFAATQPLATSAGYNQSVNNAAISAIISPVVPEPASVILLGLGLAGFGGVAAFRRRRLA